MLARLKAQAEINETNLTRLSDLEQKINILDTRIETTETTQENNHVTSGASAGTRSFVTSIHSPRFPGRKQLINRPPQ